MHRSIDVVTGVVVAACLAFASPSWASMFGSGSNTSNVERSASSQKSVVKSSATTDMSDLWWNPSESGWGMQLVQNNDLIFATLFVYGADGRPTWFTAVLNDIGGFTWTGALYANTGPWFAGPFNPLQVGARQVGALTFHATSVGSGTVTYTVDGTTITKGITRETLVNESLSGVYDLVVKQTELCSPPLPSGVFTNRVTLTLSHSGGASIVGQTITGAGTCTFIGNYEQSGKMGGVNGTYSCTSGEVGTFSWSEIVVTETALLLRNDEQTNFCRSISGQAAAVRQ